MTPSVQVIHVERYDGTLWREYATTSSLRRARELAEVNRIVQVRTFGIPTGSTALVAALNAAAAGTGHQDATVRASWLDGRPVVRPNGH